MSGWERDVGNSLAILRNTGDNHSFKRDGVYRGDGKTNTGKLDLWWQYIWIRLTTAQGATPGVTCRPFTRFPPIPHCSTEAKPGPKQMSEKAVNLGFVLLPRFLDI